MKTHVQATNFSIDRKLVDFTHRKTNKLLHFYDKIIRVDVIFRVENSSDRKNKFAELKVAIAGDNLVVKKICSSFEEAVDLTVRAAERMIIRHKELLRS